MSDSNPTTPRAAGMTNPGHALKGFPVTTIFLLVLGGFGPMSTAIAAGPNYSENKEFSFNIGIDFIATGHHVGSATTSASGGKNGYSETGPYPGTKVIPGGVDEIFAFSVGPQASALASSLAAVDVPKGLKVSGRINVGGGAFVDAPGNGAHAESNSLVRVTGFSDKEIPKDGKVTTNDMATLHTKQLLGENGIVKAQLKDPMYFEIFDLDTGDLFKDILLDFTMTLEDDGDVEWDEDGMDIDALNFEFNYDLTSPILKNKGLIEFAMAGGVVTKSVGTGILAGLLPGVGSTGPFHLNLSSKIELEYDLGDFGGHRVDISFVDEASGSADIVAVPEPGTLAAGIALAGLCLMRIRRRK